MLPAMSKNKDIWKTNMIKTLRITSIIAVVLAVVFLAFPAVFGIRSDEQAEQFLNSASAIEEFSKAKGKKSTKNESQSQISPLVKQAQVFASYLNPPKPEKAPATRRTGAPKIIPRPTGPVSPKFKLLGTSYYALHPDLSLALIDEPGKGLRWVRQSSEVGHLIIKQVKNGSVVVRDDKRTFELVAERPEKRSLLKSPSPGATGPKSILSTLGKAGARITSSRPPQPRAKENAASASDKAGARTKSRPPQPQMSPEEQAALAEKIFAELEAMQAEIESEQADSEPNAKETTAVREDLISSLEAMRISAEEAKRLNHLGKKLKDIRQDPNRAKEDKTESDANSSEPNFSEPNFSESNFSESNFSESNFSESNFSEPNFSEPNSPEEE